MHFVSKHLVKVLVTTFSLAGFAASPVFADECDYVGRHFKTDVSPVGARTYPASRSGDIFFSPSLALTIKNVGTNAIVSRARPGDLITARQVLVTMKGQSFSGFIAAPLSAGAQTQLSVSIPENFIHHCEKVTATIDADNRLGQWGCGVRGNDSITFTARFGSNLCASDIIRPIRP